MMGGMPCIRGLRVPGATVMATFADGLSEAEIPADLPYLEREDIIGSCTSPLRTPPITQGENPLFDRGIAL